MVDRQGHLGEGLTGKDHQSHAVAIAALNEVGRNLFGSLQTVWAEVLGQHGARDIHRHHDVDALHRHLLTAQAALRTCQRHHHGGDGKAAQGVGQPA